MKEGKKIELNRYEKRASNFAENEEFHFEPLSSTKIYLRKPYKKFISILKKKISKNDSILEIGSGFGQWTKYILDCDANVTASDISPESLKILEKFLPKKIYPKLKTKVVDMENITFPDNYFDCVVSAGSLSYGNNKIVMHEIYRSLKKDGYFICIDSLNNNPIYKFNRIVHVINARRSFFTIKNMPNINTIKNYKQLFKKTKLYYFGAISFLGPFFDNKFFIKIFLKISDYFDSKNIFNIFAFKFIMIAQK